MLLAFVIVYLLGTIAIGLWAAKRVKTAADFAIAGRHLPLYMIVTTTFAKMTQDLANGGNAKSLLDQAAKDIDNNLKTNNYYGY